MLGIARRLVEIDNSVKDAAGANPRVDGLANLLALVRRITGSLIRRDRSAKDLDTVLMSAGRKLAQALLFVLIGVGALRLIHKDIGDLLLRLAFHMRFNPESRFVNFVLDHAEFVTDKLLRRFSLALFAYAALGTA